MNSIINLPEAEIGGEYVIVKVDGGNYLVKKRLLEMGLIPGVKILVLGKAPLGGPIHIKVMNCNIAIRTDQAKGIFLVRNSTNP